MNISAVGIVTNKSKLVQIAPLNIVGHYQFRLCGKINKGKKSFNEGWSEIIGKMLPGFLYK